MRGRGGCMWLGEGELKNKNGVEGAWDELRRAFRQAAMEGFSFQRVGCTQGT